MAMMAKANVFFLFYYFGVYVYGFIFCCYKLKIYDKVELLFIKNKWAHPAYSAAVLQLSVPHDLSGRLSLDVLAAGE